VALEHGDHPDQPQPLAFRKRGVDQEVSLGVRFVEHRGSQPSRPCLLEARIIRWKTEPLEPPEAADHVLFESLHCVLIFLNLHGSSSHLFGVESLHVGAGIKIPRAHWSLRQLSGSLRSCSSNTTR